MAAASVRWRRPVRSSRSDTDGDAVRFGRLLIVAMTSGLGLAESWDVAIRYTGGVVGAEATELARRARAVGLATELRRVGGALEPIASRIAQAQLVGAPIVPAIRAAVERLRLESRARRIERIRTLSVRLTVPVSLFLLPGFLLVVVMPYLWEGVGAVFPGR